MSDNICVCALMLRLVAGDVDGKFKQFFAKVQGILKKTGPFEVKLTLYSVNDCCNCLLTVDSRCCFVLDHFSLAHWSAGSSGRNMWRGDRKVSNCL